MDQRENIEEIGLQLAGVMERIHVVTDLSDVEERALLATLLRNATTDLLRAAEVDDDGGCPLCRT